MTSNKLASAFARYTKFFLWNVTAAKAPSAVLHVIEKKNATAPLLSHIHYMCLEAEKLLKENRFEKATRWLGFVQGVLWAAGVYTLDDLKEHIKDGGEPDWVHLIKVEKYDVRKNGELTNVILRVDGDSSDPHVLKPGWEFVVMYRILDNKVVQTIRYLGSIDESKNPFEERK